MDCLGCSHVWQISYAHVLSVKNLVSKKYWRMEEEKEHPNPSKNYTLANSLLGDVSGVTKAMPSLEAARCAPDLIIKFSSVHVNPDSQ